MKEMRKCLQCEAKLRGRADQKFCSTQCRSTFHNGRNKEMLKFVRSVNQTLWQNRRILEKCWKSNMQQLHVSQLERMGFKFSRLTDLLQDGLHCCYDYGFRFGEENMVEIQPYREKDITDEVC